MWKIFLNVINYLFDNLIALAALIFSIFIYFKISSVQTNLNIEPILKIMIPSDFSEATFPIYIENIGKANVKNVEICWATLIKETADNVALKQSGVSPASQKLKKAEKIEVKLDINEEIEKIKNLTSNVFFLSIKTVYNREVDSQPRQNTSYFMLSHHSSGINTKDITTWRQPNFIAIQQELNELMIR